MLLILLAIAVVGFIIYWPTLKYDFTGYDDNLYVTENPGITDWSSKGINQIFHSYAVGNYHPLTMLSYAAEYHVDKLKPYIYHRDSMILLILTCFAITLLAWLLTENLIIAAFCGILYVIHPMNAESVAWVAGRKHELFGFFYFLGLIGWCYYTTSTKYKIPFYIACLAIFTLSLFSLAMAVTFPLSCLLISYYLKKPLKIRLLIEQLPFFALALIFGIVAINAQKSAGAVSMGASTHFVFLDRIMYASFAFLDYIRKLFLPFDLSNIYRYPMKTDGSLPAIWYLYPFLAVGLIFLLYRYGRKNRDIIFGFLFYLTAIALVLQFLPVGDSITADRYAYVSYFGLIFILASWYFKASQAKWAWIKPIKPALPFIVLIWFAYLGYTTRVHAAIWKDTESLCKDMIVKQPAYPHSYKKLWTLLQKQGRQEEMIPMLNNAIASMPDFYMPYFIRAEIYRSKGMIPQALADYNKSIRLFQEEADAYMGRAIVFSMQNKFDSAGKDFRICLSLDPKNVAGYLNRGNYYMMTNRFDSAMADYNKTLEMDPNQPGAYINRGWGLVNHHDYDAGIKDINEYLKLMPESGEGYIKRSYAYNYKKDYKDALPDALQAQKLGFDVDKNYIQQLGQLNGK